LRSAPHSNPQSKTTNLGRPTTPSWADFLSSGFVDEARNEPPPLLLPPDKILPPIDVSSNRGRSSQSHRPRLESNRDLEPGELASIISLDLDDTFWWVWITSWLVKNRRREGSIWSLRSGRKIIPNGKWLVMEEIIKGAAPKPDPAAYIAEKKSFWGRSKKNKGMSRTKSTGKHHLDPNNQHGFSPKQSASVGVSKTSVGPDQHARIQAAAIQLQKREREQELQAQSATRRGRKENDGVLQRRVVSSLCSQSS